MVRAIKFPGKSKTMTKFTILTYTLGLAFLFSACEPTVPALKDDPADLLINLTSDATQDAHSTLMGLHFAQNARKSGLPVTVFLNVDGVKLMSPGADTLAFDGENLQELLKALQEAGVEILACPHCMQVEGLSEGDLLKGVRLADEGTMMQKIKAGPTVMTY